MNLIVQTYYMYVRDLKILLRLPVALFPPIFIPAFLFLVFSAAFGEVARLPGFPAEDYKSFLVSLIIFQTVIFSGGDTAFGMMTDIMSGYLDKLLLAPINRFAILLGALLLAGSRAAVQVTVVVLFALALGVNFKGGPGGIVAIILFGGIFGMVWSCIGIIIALRTKNPQATQASFVLFFPAMFLTTAFMPRELLSGWFEVAVTINPINYILEGVRAIVIQGWEWSTILKGLWALLGMAVVLIGSATLAFRRATV